jgi:hypothetical protein
MALLGADWPQLEVGAELGGVSPHDSSTSSSDRAM